ncbi:MAG: hypothetical protein ACJ8GN_04720 [Longimicrobiaceae bacterium]|jgi:hypothetical protein
MIEAATATMEEVLTDFRDRFNENSRVKKLIVGWNRDILVEPLDADTAFTMTIENLEMTSVAPGVHAGGDGQVHMQADEDILKRIFTGEYNPATALIDGNMAVFSEERDKVKLEAIAMVIWGL